MNEVVFQGHPGVGPKVTGKALVAYDNFSARYDLDRLKGVFSRAAHKLHGENYVDRVLVLNTAKGGVATSWMLYTMKETGLAPAAILFNFCNPIMAQGAAFANLALVDRFDVDITEVIQTGDDVTVDPATGTVTVRRGA